MFESGFNLTKLHMESRILYPIQNLVDLTVFKTLGLVGLQQFHWILSKYEGVGLAFNQEHQALYVP
jgi:hypothetical protein